MKKQYLILLILSIQLFSCRKWLDVKSNIADITPASLDDYQAIMDNDQALNDGSPGLALSSCDNYYVTYSVWQARSATDRNCYTWVPDIYEGASPQDWSKPYKAIECTNIALEGIQNIAITPANQVQWNNVKGSALFVRSMMFFNLAQTFAPPYNAATANTDLGIPLRFTSDVNQVSVRASVEATYQQIITDLKEAENLLPVFPAYQTRPSKPAVYGLLAKVYLNMGDYANALLYADKALTAYNTLIDFNTINAALTISFAAYPNNKEVIYYSSVLLPTIMASTNPITDSTLYQSYGTNDLRKTVFYRINATLPLFKGSYTGLANSYFSGIATNELYLIRAEANARLGNTGNAMADLNALLQKRWKTGNFVPLTATSSNDALVKIITERRKELPFTGSARWEDLRRLNKDPQFAKTLIRQLNGQNYTLAPNDPKYTLPIPDIEIKLSGIQQNLR